jgi:hypothetical protein
MVYIAPNRRRVGRAHQGPVLRERDAGHGLVVSVTSLEDLDDAIAIANESGIGSESHKTMLDHDQQSKNLLVGDDPQPMYFFRSDGRVQLNEPPCPTGRARARGRCFLRRSRVAPRLR